MGIDCDLVFSLEYFSYLVLIDTMQQSSQLFSSGADPSGPRWGPEGFHTVTSAPPSYTLQMQIHHET